MLGARGVVGGEFRVAPVEAVDAGQMADELRLEPGAQVGGEIHAQPAGLVATLRLYRALEKFGDQKGVAQMLRSGIHPKHFGYRNHPSHGTQQLRLAQAVGFDDRLAGIHAQDQFAGGAGAALRTPAEIEGELLLGGAAGQPMQVGELHVRLAGHRVEVAFQTLRQRAGIGAVFDRSAAPFELAGQDFVDGPLDWKAGADTGDPVRGGGGTQVLGGGAVDHGRRSPGSCRRSSR